MLPINGLPPMHPGEFLREEFLLPLNLSANALARDLHVPPNRITAILKEQRGITADTALRLGRYFGTTAQLWLNLQTSYDLKRAQDALNGRLEQEVRVLERAA